jgi:hypothetical protein
MVQGIVMRCFGRFLGSALIVLGALAPTPPAQAQQSAAELKNPKVLIDYLEARSPSYRPLFDWVRQKKILEQYQEFMAPLKLPTPLRVRTMQCGAVNAYYDPDEWAIKLCYEIIADILKNAPQKTTAQGFTRDDAIIGGIASILLHETGHALFDILEVPVLGREEDAADQIGGFVALQFGRNLAMLMSKGAAYTWMSYALSGPPIYWDTHSTPAQRFYNYLCLGYGADPDGFKDMVQKGMLPKNRADGCAAEYQQAKLAFAKTILPHIDPELMKKVQAIKWFADATP